ncbi:MAG: AbiV family abortive infection protein [Rhizobacter sp.]
MPRQNYRNNLDFVASAFQACWSNARDLVSAAKLLLDAGLHAQALSLSVLALEELGKLFCVDGLLFARADDYKAEVFAKSLKSHTTKLEALQLLPLLLESIASVDTRHGSEDRFDQAIEISLNDLKQRGKTLYALLDGKGFEALDQLKQLGFYARPVGNGFKRPSESITIDVATGAYQLAWRATSTLDFLLTDGNLERYIERARRFRSTLSEQDHEHIAEHAAILVQALFDDDPEHEVGDDPLH